MSFNRLRRPLALLALGFGLAGALATASAFAQGGIPPAPRRWATDEAGFLAPSTVAALDARLEDFERRTGHQVLVWIGRTIGENAVLEDWAVRTFEAWKVGRRGLDDGLVLFVLAEDRRVRIEVGYGLEDRVPDAFAFRIIDRVLAPGFRAGRPDEAVERAVAALLGAISGDETAPEGGRAPSRRVSPVNRVFGGLVILVLIVLFITNPSFALWLLISILSGGRGGGRGGFGGGGSGFGGGGGRSGGGGASGSW